MLAPLSVRAYFEWSDSYLLKERLNGVIQHVLFKSFWGKKIYRYRDYAKVHK